MNHPKDPLWLAKISRRTVLETGALSLASLIIPGCGPAQPGGSTSGLGSGSTGPFTTGLSSTGGTGSTGSTGSTGASSSQPLTSSASSEMTTSSAGGPTSSGSSAASSSSAGGGCASCQNNGNTLVLPVLNFQSLLNVGQVLFTNDPRYIDPYCGGSNFAVVQSSFGVFSAFSTSCTHQCCSPPRMIQQQQGSNLLCTCHGSQFDLTGRVAAGPAYLDLPTIPVCLDGCGNISLQLA